MGFGVSKRGDCRERTVVASLFGFEFSERWEFSAADFSNSIGWLRYPGVEGAHRLTCTESVIPNRQSGQIERFGLRTGWLSTAVVYA